MSITQWITLICVLLLGFVLAFWLVPI